MENNDNKTKTSTKGLEGSLRLAGESFEQAASRVHEIHRAISDMPFKAVKTATFSASQPIESIHNEVTDFVYDIVKGTGKGVFNGAAWLIKQVSETSVSTQTVDEALDGELSRQAMQLHETLPDIPEDKLAQRLSLVASAVNGLVGDHLAVTRNPIQVKAGFYQRGQIIDLSPQGLKAAFPNAQANLVVFAHGLCCNEDAWRFYERPNDPVTLPYGDKLARQFEMTPLFLRYNTGLNIHSNGRRYRRLLKKLVANWPVPVENLILVGHSMGGLVSRVAVEDMGPGDEQLESVIRDVISLGSPHTGAPLARIAGLGENLFNQYELSKPVGKFLGIRSTGIRNLQEGLGPLQTRDGRKVSFHFMGATIAGSTGSWLNETIGDGLVQMSSALADESGDGQRLAFSAKHHMHLLNDHEIYEQIEAVIRQHLKPKLQTGGNDSLVSG